MLYKTEKVKIGYCIFYLFDVSYYQIKTNVTDEQGCSTSWDTLFL